MEGGVFVKKDLKKPISIFIAFFMVMGLLSEVPLTVKADNSQPCSKISAGYDHSLTIKNDGSLWAWGGNNRGQLGDGTTEDETIPVKIMDGIALEKTSNSTSKPVLVQQTIVLNVGEKLDLTKYLNLNGAAVTWKSNNTNAATINNGEVTAVGVGSSIINVIGQEWN